MLHKTFDLLDAKADDSAAGTFEATVAVFNNVDRGGDRIQPGAFKNTLAKWAESGDPIPVILSHQWDNPMAHIGVVEDAKETDKGLWVRGRLDVSDNDVARQVHRLMARRSLKEFSFGYDVPKGGEKRAKDGANDLTEINLAEIGPTLKGMNPATELHAVKSALAGKQLASVTRERLEGAGRERFAAGPNTYVYVDDFDPDSDWVVYCIAGSGEEIRYLKTTYAVDANGTVTLGDGEVEVQRTTTYTPKSASLELRKESERRERDLIESRFAELPPAPDEPTNQGPDLAKELQEVKSRLEHTERTLEALKKKAEETDKEQHARSVDPLRKRSEELALEIASDGMSLRKPPTPVKEPTPEPVDVDQLKRQSRDLMFEVLSYSTE